PEVGEVPLQDRARLDAPVERLADGVEREAERAERGDLLEPRHVGGGVAAVAGRRPRRGHEQPDGVVVVEGADGEAGPARELADAEEPVVRSSGHGRGEGDAGGYGPDAT